VSVTHTVIAQHSHREHQTEQAYAPGHEQEKMQKYTCPMHPEVKTDHSGNCPKCGMKLVPIKEQKRSTSNIEHRTSNIVQPETHSSHMSHPSDATHHGEMEMSMHSTIDLADPMSREGSGTSWIPDSSPMYGRMIMFGENMLMLHGAIFPRYTNVSTRRGDDRIDAPNWFMAMFSHPLGDSTQFGSRLMMSLDPLTEGGRGYPLLFQTGEVWNGEALHDRQHPHDLFDELSFSLSQKFEHDLSAYIYFGYPGEPALGPPAFMHRPSAMDDPDAPIGNLKAASSPDASRMRTVTISTDHVLIHTADAFRGTRHKIWRYKFPTGTSRVPKSSIPRPKSIARPPRRFTTSRWARILTGRTPLSGARTTPPRKAKRNRS